MAKPVVAGSTVNIFAGDLSGRLVDFTKTPSGPWQVSIIADFNPTPVWLLTPAPVWDPSTGLHVVTPNLRGQLIDYFTASTGPPFSSRVLPLPAPGSGLLNIPNPSVIAVGQPNTALVAFAAENCC